MIYEIIIRKNVIDETYGEELLSGSSVKSAVVDIGLFRQVIRWLNRRQHTFYSEERGQVSSVWWDDDQREEPPSTADYSTR